MTWIKTIGMDEDERVKKAMMDQRALYPVEYFTPVPSRRSRAEREHHRVALADSGCDVSFVQRVWRDDGTGFAA